MKFFGIKIPRVVAGEDVLSPDTTRSARTIRVASTPICAYNAEITKFTKTGKLCDLRLRDFAFECIFLQIVHPLVILSGSHTSATTATHSLNNTHHVIIILERFGMTYAILTIYLVCVRDTFTIASPAPSSRANLRLTTWHQRTTAVVE